MGTDLAKHTWAAPNLEQAIMPDLPMVDAHFHLWDRDNYFVSDFLADMTAGHNVEASVYAECSMSYSDDMDPALRPVGETRYVIDQIRRAQGSSHNMAAGILGAVDMLLGADIDRVLDAHEEAGEGRFRGIRYRAAWSTDPVAGYHEPGYPSFDVLADDRFVAGARCLMKRDLVLGLWAFHPQLADIAEFAAKLPDLTIVVDHVGGPLGVGQYADRRDEVFRDWSAGIHKLAKLPNVNVKLSGLAISRLGFGYQKNGQAGSSDELAAAWSPYIGTCAEAFGPDRALYASNYPVDRAAAPYVTLVNAYKKILQDLSQDELRAIFGRTARRIYRLGEGATQ